ncbi:MAG: putative lipid II flippase FtsW [Xanthobacteraceae bacterium]|nr:putative lipid II flippase FtsW [Xanthobacteraceae bacterium]MCW5676510.1 putative lipid II flippase FtsW [Xanthobacteraceae bacterium]
MVSRAQRTLFGEWWWTVDRLLLGALFAIVLLGIILLLAASPPLATRLGVDPFFFVHRQALYLVPAVCVLIATSLLDPRQIRRTCLIVFAVSIVLVALTPFIGAEIKGARRWLSILGFSLQPSEFMKPAFIVLTAWVFAEAKRNPQMPSTALAVASLLAVVLLLVRQPDFGQTVLIVAVWCALFFISGLRWMWVGGIGGLALTSLFAAYHTIPHVRSRIDRFLDPGSGDTFQIDTAIESFLRGGWLGRGPGEGTVKRILPDGHADFIFAVAAEEFGIILCLILVALFSFVVIRALWHASREEDPFMRLAIAGIALLFGLQSSIAMAVNLHLIPSKGMTLPFVSYGGSSLISLAFGMGMLISLTRKHPRLRDTGREYEPRGVEA